MNRVHFPILLMLTVLLLLSRCASKKPTSTVHSLRLSSQSGCVRNEWQFQHRGQWYPATVPGNIHDDLLRNRLIPDPFWGTNEDSVQWVSDSSWLYQLHFDADCVGEANYDHKELVFQGLDTYAEVWLNGRHLKAENGEDLTDNMFRCWIFDVSNVLKQKENILEVRFLPTASRDSIAAAQLSYALPDTRVFTRKAQYESGWDWGPKLNTCGIWKDVTLRLWNSFRIEDVFVRDTKPTMDTTKPWETSVEVTVVSDVRKRVHVCVEAHNTKEVSVSRRVTLEKGTNTITIPVILEHPQLWWPNGMGAQNLYYYHVTVDDGRQEDHAAEPVVHGLRTVELVREKDSIGESFAFLVNGKPCFMRGADWIPAASYPGTLNVSDGDAVYFQLLKSARDVNMNMLRVWGGGLYEHDAFYHYCDQFGLLVWQDFMFACNPYPADTTFLNNVRYEAMEQVKRLRNHPCMALWCGNNEIHNGLEDWGWQNALGWTDSQYRGLMEDFSRLFEQQLAEVVETYHPGVSYVSTSPTYGWGHAECCTHGCSHYWGVWWGEMPFEVWWDKTGRFMAEYGFQSYPELATWRSVADSTSDALRLGSATLKQHQKHARGVEIIRKAMLDDFSYTRMDNLGEFAYVSQLVQAYGIGKAIEAHRIRRDRCRGTLYWQLNDCWPVASWSSIDFMGRWKALHYRLRDVYANVAIATHLLENNSLEIYVVNDSLVMVKGELHITLWPTDGKNSISLPVRKITVPSDGVVKACTLSPKELSGMRPEQVAIQMELKVGKRLLAQKTDFLVRPGRLDLKRENIHQEVHHLGDYSEITLTSPVFQYGVFVEDVSGRGIFTDNYFHLLPGKSKTIRVDYEDPVSKAPEFTVSSFRK